MKPHRKAAPAEAAAAGRQEMPRCAPKADSGLSSAQAQALADAYGFPVTAVPPEVEEALEAREEQ